MNKCSYFFFFGKIYYSIIPMLIHIIFAYSRAQQRGSFNFCTLAEERRARHFHFIYKERERETLLPLARARRRGDFSVARDLIIDINQKKNSLI